MSVVEEDLLDDLPANIRDNTKREHINKPPDGKKAKTSSFLITVDLPQNISSMSKRDYGSFARSFLSSTNNFKSSIEQFTKKFPKNKEAFKIPSVVKVDGEFEIGTKKNHLHTHIMVTFSSVCFMDIKKIEQFYAATMKIWLGDKKPYVSARSILSDQTIKNYISKTK